jgi:hypothetical protein
MKKGHMYLNEAPGIGVDIHEKMAVKYPFQPFPRANGYGAGSAQDKALTDDLPGQDLVGCLGSEA